VIFDDQAEAADVLFGRSEEDMKRIGLVKHEPTGKFRLMTSAEKDAYLKEVAASSEQEMVPRYGYDGKRIYADDR